MRSALTIVLGFSTVSIIACGPRYRVEPVGSGVAHLGAPAPETEVGIAAGPAQAASPSSGDVAIRERGLHRVSVQLRLPHALRVHYELHCPGSITAIDDGETMEQYRTRRLAELERERERQKRAAGALTGAVLGTVGAGAAVETPNASAQVSAEADGAVVGEAVAESAIPQVQLDPRDVGARVITARHQILVDGPGRCALRVSGASPEDDASGVTGSFSVERLVDIKAEQHQARVEARKRAVSLRADVTASLVARGADPHKRERERAAARAERERVLQVKLRAEGIARAERDRKRAVKIEADRAARAERERVRRLEVNAELTARAEVTARAEARVETAMTTRGYVIAWLGRCGGDPYLRDRERAALRQRQDRERAALRQRQEARVRLTMEARGSLRANLMGLGADPEHRRKQFEAETAAYEARVRANAEARRSAELALAARTEAVLEARATLKGELQANGAVDRPPRPAPVVETRPPMPNTAAVWITGSFEWTGVAWQWRAGYWTAPPQRDAIWVAPVEVIVRGTAVLRPGAWVDRSGKPVVRDHRKR